MKKLTSHIRTWVAVSVCTAVAGSQIAREYFVQGRSATEACSGARCTVAPALPRCVV